MRRGMLYLTWSFIFSSLLSLNGVVSGYVAASPQTLFQRFPDPVTTTSQAHNSLRISAYAHPSGSPVNANNRSITAAPAGYPESCPGCCLVGHPISCTGSKTWDGPSLSLAEQCVLWNSSCKGDTNSAAQNFFDNMVMLDEKPCWKGSANVSLHCTEYEPAETLSAMSQIKDWMRGSECMSMLAKFDGPTDTPTSSTAIISTSPSTASGETCCGLPIIEAQNVDIYYWPEPGANTACLSIIGNHVNPLYYDATTGSGPAYWGCTARNPKTSISTSFLDSPGTDISWTLVTDVQSIITTAQITSVNSLTFKYPLVNPWSPPACIGVTSALQGSDTSIQNEPTSKSIHARGHSLVIPTSMTRDDGMPFSTVVSGTFTFTSPSIYANFHSITAADECGGLGSESSITQTMLTFTPGELSTIAGPLYNPVGSLFRNYETKMFDFADLPCPPQNVMEENWYMPAPGEAYRPLIALPDKVKQIDPAWSACSDAFFTGFDPPRTLVASGAMVPDVTSSHSVADPAAAIPSPSLNAGPEKTVFENRPQTISVPRPVATQMDKPASSVLDPHDERFDPSSQSQLEQQGWISNTDISNLNQQVSNAGGSWSAPTLSSTEGEGQTYQVLPGVDGGPVTPVQTPQPSLVLQHEPQSQSTIESDQNGPYRQGGSQSESQQAWGGNTFQKDPVQQITSSQSFDYPNLATHNGNSLRPSAAHFPVADDPVVAGSSPVLSQGSSSKQDESLAAAAGVAYFSHGSVDGNERASVQLPPTSKDHFTSIAGYAIKAITDGVSIHGTSITVGAAPITISGTPISVGSFRQVYLDGTPHQLPSPSPAPSLTLANGAVAVPLQNGVSIYGTTLEPGAPAITASGNAISLGDSGDLILAGGSSSVFKILTFLSNHGLPLDTTSSQLKGATSAVTRAVETLSPGALAVTVNGVAVSLDSADGLVVGSETLAMKSASGGLGGMIMGGIQSGGPYSTNSTAVAQTTSPTVSGTDPGSAPASQSRADGIKSLSPWKIVATLLAASAIVCLHV